MTREEASNTIINSQYYEKGYKEGVFDVLDMIKRDIFNACSDNYYMPVYKLSCDEIFEIIDKYEVESEDKYD